MVVLLLPSGFAYVLYSYFNLDASSNYDIKNFIYSPYNPSQDQKIVCVVFDDGWLSQYTFGLPVLNEFGFKATFAIVPSYTSHQNYMSWVEIDDLAKEGMDIESHTYGHLSLNALDNSTLYNQLEVSQQTLRSRGYSANILIYPYGEGVNNQTVQDVVSKFYLCARDICRGKGNCNLSSVDRFAIPSFEVYNSTSLDSFAKYVDGSLGDMVSVVFYHKIGDSSQDAYTVSADMFKAQMQYLHDNNFTVMTLQQLFLKEIS